MFWINKIWTIKIVLGVIETLDGRYVVIRFVLFMPSSSWKRSEMSERLNDIKRLRGERCTKYI